MSSYLLRRLCVQHQPTWASLSGTEPGAVLSTGGDFIPCGDISEYLEIFLV